MARGASVRDHDKIMMKALKRGMKKKREEKNTLPVLPDGEIFIMDSLNPGKRMAATLVRTCRKNGRTLILMLECPQCFSKMAWDEKWKAFVCKNSNHPKRKGIYELVG